MKDITPYLEELHEAIKDMVLVGYPYISSFLVARDRFFLGYPPRQLLWDFTKRYPEWVGIRRKKKLSMSVRFGEAIMPSMVIVPAFSLINQINLMQETQNGYVDRDKLIEVAILPVNEVFNI